jgi:hypothetical protein
MQHRSLPTASADLLKRLLWSNAGSISVWEKQYRVPGIADGTQLFPEHILLDS